MRFIPFGRALELAAFAIIIGVVLAVVFLVFLGAAAKAEEVKSPGLALEGGPLTGVLITQCNLIVAAYMTMPDGRLVRMDVRDQAQMSAGALQTLVHSARVSERIEIGCDGKSMEVERHEKPV